MCCFSTKHASLRRKSKDLLVWNQNNVSLNADCCFQSYYGIVLWSLSLHRQNGFWVITLVVVDRSFLMFDCQCKSMEIWVRKKENFNFFVVAVICLLFFNLQKKLLTCRECVTPEIPCLTVTDFLHYNVTTPLHSPQRGYPYQPPGNMLDSSVV